MKTLEIVTGLWLLPALLCGPAGGAETAPAKLDKAFISFRISTQQWMPEERFAGLLALLEKYKGVTDEITLFHSFTHSPVPLDEVQRRAGVAARRMAEIRKLGYRTGINVLTTIGHHEEDLPHSLGGQYTPMTDIHGSVCRGSMCPNDPRMQETIRRLYQITAAAGPDYIWIDDDVRLAGHGKVIGTCFCDNCLRIFEQEFGRRHSRESILATFDEGPLDAKIEARRKWLEHNRNTLRRLFELRFWRTRAGAEVDIVLRRGEALAAVEVKAGSAIRPRVSRGFRSFCTTYRPHRSFLLNRDQFPEPRFGEPAVVPVAAFLLHVPRLLDELEDAARPR